VIERELQEGRVKALQEEKVATTAAIKLLSKSADRSLDKLKRALEALNDKLTKQIKAAKIDDVNRYLVEREQSELEILKADLATE
jgi:hypothetical protein